MYYSAIKVASTKIEQILEFGNLVLLRRNESGENFQGGFNGVEIHRRAVYWGELPAENSRSTF